MDVSPLTKLAGIVALALAGVAPATPGKNEVATVAAVDLQRRAQRSTRTGSDGRRHA